MRRTVSLLTEFLWPDRGPVRGVPSMDGGLTPNDALDTLEPAGSPGDLAPEDVLVEPDGSMVVTSGAGLWRVVAPDVPAKKLADLPGEARGVAVLDEETFLVCVDGPGLVSVDRSGRVVELLDPAAQGSVGVLSAVAVLDGRVFVSEVSRTRGWDEWPWALYSREADGRVLEVRDGAVSVVADGLAWPYGLSTGERPGRLVVSESFAHQISTIEVDGGARGALAARLPGYPARLHVSDRGLWVAFFGMRTHMVEFILREDAYRRRMMETIPVDEWILPALRRSASVREPLQVGGVKHLGEVKPWSPPRSYGLVAELGWDGEFLRSLHSRPGGSRHGTTAVAASGAVLAVAARGAEALLLSPGAHVRTEGISA